MGKSIYTILIVVAAAAALITGCAGSDDEPLSKGLFIIKAKDICSKASKEQFAAFEKALKQKNAKGEFSPASKDEVEAVSVKLILPRARQMVDELADLEGPAAIQDKFDALIGQFETGVAQAEKKPATFVSGKAFAKADKAAQAFGLASCQI